jgi:hypothetical protein
MQDVQQMYSLLETHEELKNVSEPMHRVAKTDLITTLTSLS